MYLLTEVLHLAEPLARFLLGLGFIHAAFALLWETASSLLAIPLLVVMRLSSGKVLLRFALGYGILVLLSLSFIVGAQGLSRPLAITLAVTPIVALVLGDLYDTLLPGDSGSQVPRFLGWIAILCALLWLGIFAFLLSSPQPAFLSSFDTIGESIERLNDQFVLVQLLSLFGILTALRSLIRGAFALVGLAQAGFKGSAHPHDPLPPTATP
ncbi:MAG: hypothetical protein Q7R81_00890 [Candidatus Peregrinibacteria bacterium]|nr:hypothetical protein [Candidatus Peregrinibacteria bacterium]